MLVNDVILLIEDGIEPVNEFWPIWRDCRFIKALILSGIGPINLLEYSTKFTSDAILPNEVGIDPLSELSYNNKLTSDVNALKIFRQSTDHFSY